jgi:hypothetical protein
MRSFTVDTTETLEALSCCNCGVLFAFPVSLVSARRKDGQNFWCPNGHRQLFTETEADRLRKRLAAAEASVTSWRDQARAAEGSLRATRGQLTRARNRQKAGVCPVDGCKRHFENLQRHIATKHPEMAAKEVDAPIG